MTRCGEARRPILTHDICCRVVSTRSPPPPPSHLVEVLLLLEPRAAVDDLALELGDVHLLQLELLERREVLVVRRLRLVLVPLAVLRKPNKRKQTNANQQREPP